MNRHRRRPLKLHLRTAPKQKVLSRSSRKLSLKVILPGVLLALIMAGALGFAAVAFLKNARLKHQGHATVASPSPIALLAGTVNPVPTTVSSPPVASVSATPAPSTSPARVPLVSTTPASSPSAAPILHPTPLVRNAVAQEAKSPSETTRKTAEQKRREAERKRAKLEALHKNHQISDEAYKQGQQEYQAEMEKYRNVVSGAGPTNRTQ
ncbi:MAG: hypothetical protein JO170_10395 [Verrucomicrobia bacterium]|nr:hypothetical protein [Verrucomicrobiota bacterium]